MVITSNLRAFLDMVAHSEIGPALLAKSNNGYNVLVGSTPARPLLFHGYADHPNIFNRACNSTAAGRYQLLARYWRAYKGLLHLPDFSPASQDAVALQQIGECGAIPAIEAGRFEDAVQRVARIWASLPGAGYGQHENRLADLASVYRAAGGATA